MMVTVKKWLIIKHINCVHDLHLKPVFYSVAVSIKDTALSIETIKAHIVTVSIQDTASQLTDELPVYTSIQAKNTNDQDHS